MTVVHALQDILSGVSVVDVCVDVVGGLGMMMSPPKYLSILSSITPAATRDDNDNYAIKKCLSTYVIQRNDDIKIQQKYFAFVARL